MKKDKTLKHGGLPLTKDHHGADPYHGADQYHRADPHGADPYHEADPHAKDQTPTIGRDNNDLRTGASAQVASKRTTGPDRSFVPSAQRPPRRMSAPKKIPRLRTKMQCLVLGAAGAGKTSIMRRYFFNTFEEHARAATLGSDFYTGHVLVPNANGEGDHEIDVNLQMWDTPGTERFYLNKRKRRFTASLSDSFFGQADAVMLVYDMTSSTSFTQLLRWYADLLEIKKTNPFPILIVGNKLDLFLANKQRMTSVVHPRRVPCRNVMGLNKFRGHDFRYEYRVSPIQPAVATNLQRTSQEAHGTFENSFFLANRENWTTDNSYLDSLLNSEDASSPDRDMVLLWCMRNGLEHMEVSAATGEGVSAMITRLLGSALKQSRLFQPETVPPEKQWFHQEELNFQERYAAKEEPCCFCLRPLPQWFSK